MTFCLPYVILQVLPKLQQMDKALPEAAMDLGCTPMQAFFKVELPEMLPGIITGAIMAFTLSLDDFVISYFTSGNGFETLPIRIYSMTKKAVTPKMYALATIIFFVTMSLLLISNLVDNDDRRKLRGPPEQAYLLPRSSPDPTDLGFYFRRIHHEQKISRAHPRPDHAGRCSVPRAAAAAPVP